MKFAVIKIEIFNFNFWYYSSVLFCSSVQNHNVYLRVLFSQTEIGRAGLTIMLSVGETVNVQECLAPTPPR